VCAYCKLCVCPGALADLETSVQLNIASLQLEDERARKAAESAENLPALPEAAGEGTDGA
jgi:hypothetical protein